LALRLGTFLPIIPCSSKVKDVRGSMRTKSARMQAVNDAGTAGDVCGQLAGAHCGAPGIPQERRDGSAGKGTIEKALQGLLRMP
jgi:hypothetical protein